MIVKKKQPYKEKERMSGPKNLMLLKEPLQIYYFRKGVHAKNNIYHKTERVVSFQQVHTRTLAAMRKHLLGHNVIVNTIWNNR